MKDLRKTTDWWWIDYLEDLLGPDLERDLQSLLATSEQDRDAFEAIRTLREWLAACDPIGDWPIDKRLNRLTAKVMAVVESGAEPRSRADKNARSSKRTRTATAAEGPPAGR